MIVLIRGGGDLASGVAIRLHRAGLRVIILELPQPMAIRRLVSFAEAIYSGRVLVEEVIARRVNNTHEALHVLSQRQIPVMVDPEANCLSQIHPQVLIDARMTKQPPESGMEAASLVIGLGPGFWAGKDCHAVIETKRGHQLGRVIWKGPAETDTSIPDRVADWRSERVLRAPVDGTLIAFVDIGTSVKKGERICSVGDIELSAPFNGVVRGLLYPGLEVLRGAKIGDLDPRDHPEFCTLVSDKALAIGGGVLEAILSRSELRPFLWD